jgi:hypothetical protein
MLKINFTQILMSLGLVLSVMGLNAQPILTENFEGTMSGNGLPTGWAQDTSVGNSQGWRVGNEAAASSQYFAVPATTKFLYINDDDCNCNMANERAILPELNFSTVSGVSINFDFYSEQYYGSLWGVEVSTDSGATWTSVLSEGTNSGGWSSKSVNLGAYAGQPRVWIAFKYEDLAQWAGGLAVDNIAVEPTPNFDLALGLPSEDANGWTRDIVRIPGFQYMPVNQLEVAELLFGATVTNRGVNAAPNTYVRLNVDRFTAPSTFTNVYTDTIRYGTVASDSTVWNVKDMSSMSWATVGAYRYEYIVVSDNTDEKPTSDTVRGTFNLTQNIWSKVDLATDGGPFGDNAYLPGVTPPNFIALQEWGTMYYMPNGLGEILDTLQVRLFSATSATATQASYQARIYKIVDNGDGVLDILVDKSLQAIVTDTVTVTPGAGYVRNLTNFIDINTFNTFEFKDTSIYYISIYQRNDVAPGLNNGLTGAQGIRNGLFVYGQTINHEGFVFGNGSNFQFYNPLIVQDGVPSGTAPAIEAFEYGWNGGPEPSMVLKFAAPVSVNTTIAELEGVELFPNPTVKDFTVNLELDNASDVKYILTDLTGRVLDIKFAKNVTTESRSWDISNYPSGVYFMNVHANGKVSSKRIVKK